MIKSANNNFVLKNFKIITLLKTIKIQPRMNNYDKSPNKSSHMCLRHGGIIKKNVITRSHKKDF